MKNKNTEMIFGIVGAGAVIVGILTGNKSMKQFKSEYYAEPEKESEIDEEKKLTNEVEDELKIDENRVE